MRTTLVTAMTAIAVAGTVLVRTESRSGPPQQLPPRASLARDYPVQPVPFTSVRLTDEFWAPKIEINRTASIPAAFQQCEVTGRVDLFVRAAAVLRGETIANTRPPGYPFDDTDVYKVIEGASYTLSVHPDPKLDAYVDSLIAKIAAAQEKDGYLYTTRTINPAAPHRWAGKQRWELEKVDSHELYNLGHMIEAAVAHYQATGKRTFLDVAINAADMLVRTFGPGKASTWPGHQITEMALVRLYRVTGTAAYADLAKFFLDVRRPDAPASSNWPPSYHQAQAPVIEQTEAVGHAVRATYMYSGMADVAALTGDQAYLKALTTIWGNLVGQKFYITGGIGSTGSGEGFGPPYDLPNMSAYNETCASIGVDFWNLRMFLLTGDAQYIDVMERTLYNGLISGVSLDGKTYFYPNPLESRGQHARREWFGVACCPGNITRFLPSVPGYVYAKQGATIFVNLFAAGDADVALADGRAVKLTQTTRYPWDGAVKMTVAPDRAGPVTLKIRIPGWARNQPVPGDLYRFESATHEPASVRVNGAPVSMTLDKGYVSITRDWRASDSIELLLPMPVQRVVAHERVEADRGRVAFQRGPIVFAAEWPDNPDARVRNLVVADAMPMRSEFRPSLLGGVQVVTARATALALDATGAVTKKDQPFVAIPYYAWSNRGPGEMAVWLGRTEAVVTPAPFPTLAMMSRVAVSGEPRRSARMINDGEDPRRSSDSSAYFDWWPANGRTETADMTFPSATTVSEVQVYWFDDQPRGGVRVPESWRLLYRVNGEWRPVQTTAAYGTDKDKYNVVAFTPVRTDALRLEIKMFSDRSAGIQEWKVR
ncbi:MAG TPA: glycoside hydrolase family 127 protein [Vicinamibacterales bacterium]|nr:glycoside hydrolase family 127 protein [Vicinamibacterales bacterium]